MLYSWGIKNQLDVTCYFYFTYYLLNMFRTLICPSSGACDCVDRLPHRLACSLFVVCWGLLRMMFGGVRLQVAALQQYCSAATCKRTPPNITRSKHQHTTEREQNKRCGNPSTSRKLLKMEILKSETCWANNKWNKNNKLHQVGS